MGVNLYQAINKILFEKTENKKDKLEIEDDKIKEKEDEDHDDKKEIEDVEDGDIVVSFKLNDNTKSGGGQIKLVDYRKLSGINKIEDIIELFNVDLEKIKGDFKNKLEITITSPLKEFADDLYIIRLMDGVGEIFINIKDKISNTITKYGKGKTSEEEADISYLDDLNFEFRQAIKNEFFNKILGKR